MSPSRAGRSWRGSPDAPPAHHLALPILGLVAALAIQPRLIPEFGIDRPAAIALAEFLVARLSGDEEPA